MRRAPGTVLRRYLLAVALCGTPAATAAVDDRLISIATPSDVATRRAALIEFVWGTDGFPSTALPASVQIAAPSPIGPLANLARMDTLTIRMERGRTAYAHHFIPSRANGRLVIVHNGHSCSFNDRDVEAGGGGVRQTITELLADGYGVLAVYMPFFIHFEGVHNCPSPFAHDHLFATAVVTTGSVMKYFLEPVAVGLNYLQSQSTSDGFPTYRDFSMTGLSGGGWTTTVYAALDERIGLSIPVAGSLPLYMRLPPKGDAEQVHAPFYAIAGYPDLYVMGAAGAGRAQIQVLNRRDSCCFGEAQHSVELVGLSFDDGVRAYEADVRRAIARIGAGGSFQVEIDEAATGHMISRHAAGGIILAALNGGGRSFAAAGSHVFTRGADGDLWIHDGDDWTDSGLPMVGTPAAVLDGIHPIDVVFRAPTNQLMHAYWDGAAWHSNALDLVALGDPAVASGRRGRFDVAVFGADYSLSVLRARRAKGVGPPQVIADPAAGIGPPALAARGSRLDVLYRAFDRNLRRYAKRGSRPWVAEVVGGPILDLPAVVMARDRTLRVYARGADDHLWEARHFRDGSWQWSSVSAADGGQAIASSPSAHATRSALTVYARSSAGSLLSFRQSEGWTSVDHGGSLAEAPSAAPSGVWTRGPDGRVWWYDGAAWQAREPLPTD